MKRRVNYPRCIDRESLSSRHTSINRARSSERVNRQRVLRVAKRLASQSEVAPTFIRALSVAPRVPAHEMIRGRSSALFGAALKRGQVHLRACSSSLTTSSVQP
jgi:hypothetical protein